MVTQSGWPLPYTSRTVTRKRGMRRYSTALRSQTSLEPGVPSCKRTKSQICTDAQPHDRRVNAPQAASVVSTDVEVYEVDVVADH
ncbi:hypothetical protein J1614_002386 [Plenodomus biglobosus]|nr:hypothetical protein J1614_002386 [Plenodomus biglobosus]